MDLKRKIGPFPLYVWAGAGTVCVLVVIIWMRRGGTSPAPDGTVDALADTDAGLGGIIDPTTGLPYSGMWGGAGGLTGVATPEAAGMIPASDAVGVVAGLVGQLTDAGLINTGYGYQDTSYFDDRISDIQDAVVSLQATRQAEPAHTTPAGGANPVTTIRPSKTHGNELWVYRKNSNGSLTPLHKAPAGAKASPKQPGTTSGARTAPKTGSSATSGQSVTLASGAKKRAGDIVQKKSEKHGNKMSNYRVNSNGSLTWVGLVK